MPKRYFLFFAFLFAAIQLSAAPHRGDLFSLQQPDGSRVQVKVYGDEYYQRIESVDGYTLVRDPESGWIQYADRSEDGDSLIPSGRLYLIGDEQPPRQSPEDLPFGKHLSLSDKAIASLYLSR